MFQFNFNYFIAGKCTGGCAKSRRGVYYEVFAVDEMESNEITIRSIGKSVTREVIYSGIVIPSKKLSWSEKIDGANYSGTLTLSGYSHTTNNTVATYRGTLYKE